MRLRKPVVVGPDKAVLEIAGGHAVVMTQWSPEALADAVRRSQNLDDFALQQARRHAAEFTWSRTVAQTRRALVDSSRTGG